MTTIRHRTRLFTYLDGSGHQGDEVGGKAAALDRLVGADYPVPLAGVITTAAYRQVTTCDSVRLLIEDLRISTLPQPSQIAAESAAIERIFLAAAIPDEVKEAIDRAGSEMLAHGPLAVRSSATAEDQRDASFAGQYLSVVNVAGIHELHRAVRRCWASLWMPAARAYRRRHRVAESPLAMAVIIQSMVDPEWSGVAFTADPGGQSHLMRVEAVPGLGEDLVAGRVTPADYLVRKDTLEILPTGDGARLDFIEDLARLALRIEQTERTPQDIEWAYTAGGIYLLQARPITDALTSPDEDDGLDTAGLPDAVYTPHGVIEMLPGVVPPLLWTINAPMLENAFRSTFADLGGSPPDRDRRLVARFRGRAALDLSAICEIANSLPGGNPAEVERQYLGRAVAQHEVTRSRGVHILAALRGRRTHNRIVDEVELIATTAEALAGMGINLGELPARRLIAYRQRIRDLAWRGYAAEVGASSAAGATYRALEILLERWLPTQEAASWAQAVTRGALSRSTVGAARSRRLQAVLTDCGNAQIRQIIHEHNGAARAHVLQLGSAGHAFIRALDAAVRLMGSKAVYGGSSWAEDDWWVWRQLQLLTDAESASATGSPDPDDTFQQLCARLRADKRWRRIRILTGQFIDLRVRWLSRQITETIRFIEMRERAKNALLILGGEERRIVIEAAKRLLASRQVTDLSLVEYLSDAELEGMLFGHCGVDSGELARRRTMGKICAGHDPLPDWFTGSPDTVPIPLDSSHPGDRFDGWAAGPGIASGQVRIVTSLDEGTQLQRGDVLVAHATDPSWTPLFLIAGAIVLETGGPLSHAAIVAREFGLPAVLNIPQITKLLHEGETVTVDGTLGFVARNREGSPQ